MRKWEDALDLSHLYATWDEFCNSPRKFKPVPGTILVRVGKTFGLAFKAYL